MARRERETAFISPSSIQHISDIPHIPNQLNNSIFNPIFTFHFVLSCLLSTVFIASKLSLFFQTCS